MTVQVIWKVHSCIGNDIPITSANFHHQNDNPRCHYRVLSFLKSPFRYSLAHYISGLSLPGHPVAKQQMLLRYSNIKP